MSYTKKTPTTTSGQERAEPAIDPYRLRQAEEIGLAETLPTLDHLPELKQQLEIFMIAMSVSRDVYAKTNEDQTLLGEAAFNNRVEQQFFSIFQEYIGLRQAREIYALTKRVDPVYGQRGTMLAVALTLISVLTMIYYGLYEPHPEQKHHVDTIFAYGMSFIATLAALQAAWMQKLSTLDYRKRYLADINKLHRKNYKLGDITNFQQFTGPNAPLRMIDDFYKVAQALYKSQKIAQTYLESSDSGLQQKGKVMMEKNKILAQDLARFASVIEARLKTGNMDGSAEAAFASLVNLKKLAEDNMEDTERLEELRSAMAEVDAILAPTSKIRVPETPIRVDTTNIKAGDQSGIIDEEFMEEGTPESPKAKSFQR